MQNIIITDPGSAFAGGPWLPFREGVAFASSVAFQQRTAKMHARKYGKKDGCGSLRSLKYNIYIDSPHLRHLKGEAGQRR